MEDNAQVLTTVKRLIDNNKAIAAFLAPTVSALGGIVVNFILTGNWDWEETRVVLAGAAAGAVAATATWMAKPGRAVINMPHNADMEYDDELQVDPSMLPGPAKPPEV
jgi:hypothetical protein